MEPKNKPIHKITLKAKVDGTSPKFVDIALGWPSDGEYDQGVRYSLTDTIVSIEVRDWKTGEITVINPKNYHCNQYRDDAQSAPTQQRSISRKHRETRAADPIVNDIGGDDEIPF